jgi:Ala-tRNA(Pro) deacylase
MDKDKKVFDALDSMGIVYEVVEHPPATSIEKASEYIEGKQGVRTKTLFLTNQKKTAYYLVVTDEGKRINLQHLADSLHEKRMKFSSESLLKEKLGTVPGVVSIFGLLCEQARDVHLIVDNAFQPDTIVTFHPDVNTKTLFMTVKDMKMFAHHLGIEVCMLSIA